MVLEAVVQLYKCRRPDDFLNISDDDACCAFALRSPFSYEKFLTVVQLTYPSFDKFGLLKALKDTGDSRILIPLSQDNFAEVVSETIRQSNLEGTDLCSRLQICGWTKTAHSVMESVESKAMPLGRNEDNRYSTSSSPFDHGHLDVERLEKKDTVNWRKQSVLRSDNSANWRDRFQSSASRENINLGSRVDVPPQKDQQTVGGSRFRSTCETNAQGSGSSKPSKRVRRALARFVKHVNLDDGAVVYSGAPFVKVWRIRNDDDSAWPHGSAILAVGGESMLPNGAPERFDVPSLQPGEERDIQIPLVAPQAAGRYQAFFRFCSPDGKKFGQRLSCQIMVKDIFTSSSETSSSDSSSESSCDASKSGACQAARKRRNFKDNEKQRRKDDKKKHRLERRAFKLRKKLRKIEKKLTRLERGRERQQRKQGTQGKVHGDGYIVAKPAEVQDSTDRVTEHKCLSSPPYATEVQECFEGLNLQPTLAEMNASAGYQQLSSMGFTDLQIREALARNNGDVIKCIEDLTK